MPAAAEEILVSRDLALSQLTGARLHIAHVSTAGSVDLIRCAKEKGILVTAEVTPHHLTLTEEKVIGYNTNAKVNPPLRTRKDIAALIEGLRDNTIDAIATDHSPHATVDKLCEFDSAAFGISGFETALGSLMSLVHNGELDLIMLISKLTIEPARIVGAGNGEQGTRIFQERLVPRSRFPFPSRGTLKVDAPADITIFDPEAEWIVKPESFVSMGRNTPLAGSLLKGKVMATIVGGIVAYGDESIKISEAVL